MEKQLASHINKRVGKELKKVIYKLISKVWEEEIIPQEWKYGIKCSICKKGDVMMCDNYRAVTLLRKVK